MEQTLFSISSSKEPWLKKALEEASLAKRELFREFAFWLLEQVYSGRFYFAESIEEEIFRFNRVSGEFEYSFECVPERIMDFYGFGKTYEFLLAPTKARFLAFFVRNIGERIKILRQIVEEDRVYSKSEDKDSLVSNFEKESEIDLEDFYAGRRKRKRKREA